ncbi:hypothetical protein NX027_25370, partial [Escherichia coli]|nr:hypothetical protein [Escherichia coli]
GKRAAGVMPENIWRAVFVIFSAVFFSLTFWLHGTFLFLTNTPEGNSFYRRMSALFRSWFQMDELLKERSY